VVQREELYGNLRPTLTSETRFPSNDHCSFIASNMIGLNPVWSHLGLSIKNCRPNHVVLLHLRECSDAVL
jgi:hypothetical protein